MRTIFFGSSDYCLPILNSIANNFKLTVIVTKQDSAVFNYAQKNNIKVSTPKDRIELSHLISPISQINPDLAIVADYGLIIPKETFSIPRFKTLNIHFSKLPKLRGPSPVQYTILPGEKSAWISVIIMDEEMDTGDIIWQKEVPITSTETTESLYKTLFRIAADELPNIINGYANHQLTPIKQDHSKATYTKRLTREDGFIPAQILSHVILSPDFTSGRRIPLEVLKTKGILRLAPQDDLSNLSHLPIFIERASRALSPWPGLWTNVSIKKSSKDLKTPRGWPRSAGTLPMVKKTEETKRLKILAAHLETANNLPLQYISRHTEVVREKANPPTPASQGETLQGYRLIIDLVQLEGKKPVSWKQFVEGYPEFSF